MKNKRIEYCGTKYKYYCGIREAVALLVNYQIQLKKFDNDIQSRIIEATQLEVDMEDSN